MEKYCRFLLVPVALAVATLGVFHPSIARADNAAESVVESSQDFCVNPAQPCSDSAHRYNLGYAEVAAVNFSNQAIGKPGAVVFVCAKAYLASNGDVHDLAGHAFPGYDHGTINGNMEVVHNATEADTYAIGRVRIVGYDSDLGTTASASGTQFTNNVTDLPLQGTNITVQIHGNLEDSDVTTGAPTTIVHGSISCQIHLPYAIGPAGIGQPPDSESVISDSDGD